MSQDRKLGRFETATCNRKFIWNCVIPTKLTIKHQQLDVDLMKRSTYLTIKSQPNLNAALRKEGEELYFAPLDEVRNYFEELPPETKWKDVCIKYCNSHLRKDFETFPPVKLFLIQPSYENVDLILVYSHYCGDGTNGMSITNQILTTYINLKEIGVDYTPPSQPVPCSVEEMAQSLFVTTSEMDEFKVRYAQYNAEVLDNINCNIHVDLNDESKGEFLTYTSTSEVYDRLLAACRRSKVTVGSALLAAQSMGIAALLFSFQEMNVPEELFIATNLPINYRGRVPSTADIPWQCVNACVCNFLVGYHVTKTTKFLELSQTIRRHMVDVMSAEKKLHAFDVYQTEGLNLTDHFNRVSAMLSDHATRHTCVSNMLKYPGTTENKYFKIDSIHCVGGNWLRNDNPIELMIYSTNKLNLSMVHWSGEKNTKQAQFVFKCVQYLIETMEIRSVDDDITVEDLMKTFE